MMKNYCIREDYITKDENRTLESEGNVFWNKERIYYSSLYQWHVYHYALDIIKRNRIKNVLDIGCGTAYKLVNMLSPAADIYGIDQPSAIEYCKSAYKVGTFYTDNFEDPKVFIDLPFGLIICSDVIEHMADPDSLINYIKRFCSKDTYILFSTPDRDRLRGKDCLYSPKKEHVREWNASEFREYLKKRGFTVLEQKHMPPVKSLFGALFFKHLFAQIKALRPYKYNQAVLCKLKDSSNKMTIVYPINETLMLRKARDARIMRMSASWAAQGHRVYLIVGKNGTSREEVLEYYGIENLSNLEIIQIPILRKNNVFGISWNGVLYLFLLIKLIKLSRQERIDVIYLSVFKLASFLLSWKRWIRADRFVYEVHELGIYPETRDPNWSQIRLDRLERKVLPEMDGVITTTKVLKEVLGHRFPRLPVAAIPLGTIANRSRLHTYSFIRKDLYNVCYIGQLYEAQGVDLLIHAFTQVREAHLHIVGGEEEQVSKLKSLTEKLGVHKRITFYGFVPPGKIQELIQQVDIFVVPSRDTVRMNYVAHIKIYEYMSYGRPIIATSLRSTLEELRDGENAILVKPDDPLALADGLKRLIGNPELAQRIAVKALEIVPLYYWENRTRMIEQFILGLHSNHRCQA